MPDPHFFVAHPPETIASRHMPLMPDDRRFHRPQNAEQIGLLFLGHLKPIERGHQVLDHGIKRFASDGAAFMCRNDIGAGVLAWPAGALAQEIGETPFVCRCLHRIGSGGIRGVIGRRLR